MNNELQFKVQALVDGELSERDAREISAKLKDDSQASALFNELQAARAALRGNELDLKLPESREFYWSKIQREISRGTKEVTQTEAVRWWKPAYVKFAGMVAAGCAVLMLSFMAFNGQNGTVATDEVEGTGEEMGSITYHSDKEDMTVVYLFDREAPQMADAK